MQNSTSPLIKLLQTCTVRVWSPGRKKLGTGFFVSPRHIVTCAHVVGQEAANDQTIEMEWGTQPLNGKLKAVFPVPCPIEKIFPDIAIIETAETDHPIAFLDQDYALNDPLLSWGYSDLRPAGESIWGTCELDAKYDHTPEGHLIKFKETQIRPGISGSPLLNGRTGAICGMVKRTRDSETDAGGLAVRAEVLIKYLGEIVGDEQRRKIIAEAWLKARSDSDTPFQQYLTSLKQFTDSAYRVLPLPRGLSLDEVYVPQRARSLDQNIVVGTFDLKGIFRNLTFSPKGRHLLVEGNPGAGKSTLLRHLAHNAFDRPADIGLDKRKLPLLVRLHSLARSSGASIEDRLLAAIGEARDYELSSRPEPGFLAAWPKRQDANWLILLDGFDEVPSENRSEIKSFIKRLQALGDLVITSRPTDSLAGIYADDFNRYAIEPFNPEQQQLLATKWFGQGAEEFLAVVRGTNGGTHFLGTTPLLLTIAACVYTADKRLPSRRVDLYRRFIDCWWEEAVSRGVLHELGGELNDYGLPGLQDIALEMTKNVNLTGTNDIVAQLAEVVSGKFHKSVDIAQSMAKRFVEVMGRRSGIFMNRGVDCEWLHRTFREFMCANAFAYFSPESKEAIAIAKEWRTDEWRQVLLFSLSLWSERTSVSPLLRRLSRLSPPYGAVLAAEAITEGTKVDDVLLRDVIDLLCREALANARGTICNRLLAGITDDSKKRADQTLRALLQLKQLPSTSIAFTALVNAMVTLAREWDKGLPSAAISDLAALRQKKELIELANDRELMMPRRFEAARGLRECGANGESISALCSLIGQHHGEPQFMKRAIDELGEAGGYEELLRLVQSRSINSESRLHVAEVLDERAMLPELSLLANNQDLDPEIRRRALIGLLGRAPSDQMQFLIDKLFIVTTGGITQLSDELGTLASMKNWKAIVEIARNPGVEKPLAEKCISLLGSYERIDELLHLVRLRDLPYEFRSLAAQEAQKRGKTEGVGDELLNFYGERLAQQIDDFGILKARANLYLSLGRQSEAINDIDRIITNTPDDGWFLSLRANAYRQLEKYERAITDFDRALALDKSDAWDLIRRGLSYYELSRWNEAASDFAAAEQLESKERHFYKYYADALNELGRYQEGFRVANKAINADPLSPMCYVVRGCIYSALARWSEALQDFSQTLLLNPESKWALVERAQVHRCTNQFDRCIDDLNTLLGLSADHRWGRYARCEVSLRLRDFETASQDIALLSPETDKFGWLTYLRWLLATLNDDPSLDSDLLATKAETERKLLASPTSLYLRSNLAVYELAIGDPGKSRSIYEQLIGEGQLKFIRQTSLPEICDFAALFPDRLQATDLSKELVIRVESLLLHCNLIGGPVTDDTDERSSRFSPVYCPLYVIHGLENEKARAEKLLRVHADQRKTVVVWKLDRDWIYGQCNFKYAPEHKYNLKFVDTLDTVLNRDLEIFASAGVVKMLFLDQDLLDTFKKNRDVDFDSFRIDFDLVKEDDPNWAAVG